MQHNNMSIQIPLEELDAFYTRETNVVSPREQRVIVMSGTPADRAEFTRAVAITVDGYRRSMKVMEQLLQRAERTKCPGGLLLTGDGGEGKTFILQKFLQAHPVEERKEYLKCPVLMLPLSWRPSVSDILLMILMSLGYPPNMIRSQTNSEFQKLVIRALINCEVRMLIFDEAQHLWLSASGKSSRPIERMGKEVGEFLKSLYDQSGVAYVFSGTNGLKDYFRMDAQANTRWSENVQLYPFGNDDKFREALMVLDEALPMESPSSLHSEKLAPKIFLATKGNFRLLKNLLSEAVFLAATQGAKYVSESHLAQSYFQLFGDEQTPFGEYLA